LDKLFGHASIVTENWQHCLDVLLQDLLNSEYGTLSLAVA